VVAGVWSVSVMAGGEEHRFIEVEYRLLARVIHAVDWDLKPHATPVGWSLGAVSSLRMGRVVVSICWLLVSLGSPQISSEVVLGSSARRSKSLESIEGRFLRYTVRTDHDELMIQS